MKKINRLIEKNALKKISNAIKSLEVIAMEEKKLIDSGMFKGRIIFKKNG